MIRFLIAAASAAALLPVATAAAGPEYFFSCTADSKVQNNQPEGWSTSAPSASFQSGAGCGSLDVGLYTGSLGGQEVDFFGGGLHTGAIQSINVELHSLLLSQVRVPPTIGAEVELIVDGEDVLGGVQSFRAPTETSATGLTQAFRFSIAREPVFDENDNELPPEPLVAGAGEHTVALRFSSEFADYQNLWVWGASEVPAHVTIDPATLSSPSVLVP